MTCDKILHVVRNTKENRFEEGFLKFYDEPPQEIIDEFKEILKNMMDDASEQPVQFDVLVIWAADRFNELHPEYECIPANPFFATVEI